LEGEFIRAWLKCEPVLGVKEVKLEVPGVWKYQESKEIGNFEEKRATKRFGRKTEKLGVLLRSAGIFKSMVAKFLWGKFLQVYGIGGLQRWDICGSQ